MKNPLDMVVIGASAGGALPQWNCGCANCEAARRGEIPSSTQDSVAVRAVTSTADDEGWFLVNASPDVLRQIQQTPALQPKRPRHSPVKGIVLTNGDLDHVLGLFSLRESQPLALYATAAVLKGLEENAFMRTLRRFPGQLVVRELALGREVELAGADGAPGGVFVTPFPADGKLPVHLMAHGAHGPEDNVGLVLRGRDGGRAVYLAAAASVAGLDFGPGGLAGDVLFMDGTFWSEDEMASLGLSKARAKDMAHMPVGGPDGSLAALRGVPFARRIYTHVNNTNPVLRPGSDERRAVEAEGWEIAFDGLRISVG